MTTSQKTVGVLGGGQLARMLALAGAPLGVRFKVVDQSIDACASQVAPLLQADYTDLDALLPFASEVDVVTFDFENVPAESAAWLASRVPVFPNPEALAIAQDRLEEKNLFRELGMGTPDFHPVESLEDLKAAVDFVGIPSILKTRRLGYDGKGQFRIRSEADVEAAWHALGGVPLILEEFVEFEREVSVIGVRSRAGEFRAYPLVQNWHADGILSASLAPAPDSSKLQRIGHAHAQKLAERLGYVGVFALELFVTRGGELLANEMAPRVHNSGHWTIEGAYASQFENHVRAVLGLPLGSTNARGPSVMLNFVGTLPDAEKLLWAEDAHWHDYGKEPREGRKVGHATVVGKSTKLLREKLEFIGEMLGRIDQLKPVMKALK